MSPNQSQLTLYYVVLQGSTIRKRKMYEEFLTKVSILGRLWRYLKWFTFYAPLKLSSSIFLTHFKYYLFLQIYMMSLFLVKLWSIFYYPKLVLHFDFLKQFYSVHVTGKVLAFGYNYSVFLKFCRNQWAAHIYNKFKRFWVWVLRIYNKQHIRILYFKAMTALPKYYINQ